MLREGLFHRLSELVGGGAGGIQPDQEGEHLLAERILDQRRLVGPLAAEDLAEALGLGFDAALAAGSLEGGLDPGAGQPCGPGRGRGGLEEFAGLGTAQAVGPDGEGRQGGGVVLAQQGPELVGELLPVPQRVLLGAAGRRSLVLGRSPRAGAGGRACRCGGCSPGPGRRRREAEWPSR
ncbi:hypothetical protein GCM10017562_02110 [Streptomyces roseofulvus]